MGDFALGKAILGFLLFIVSLFMILLILVQRGKGGGLTGALGGMGGQSAFGSKAGDLFTRITVVTAIIWITLCMLTIALYNPPPRPEAKSPGPPAMGTSSETGDQDTTGAEGDSASSAAEDAFEDPADNGAGDGAPADDNASDASQAGDSDPALVPPDESGEGQGGSGDQGSDSGNSGNSNDSNGSGGGSGL